MEEETLASSEVPVVKVVEEIANNVDPNKVKEVDETTFEGEFIEVEKESVVDGKPCANEQSSSNSYPSREILESQEKEKLEESGKRYDELELSHKKLQDQIYDSEERYNVQLNTLQEVLQAQEAKQKELIGVKEAFDGLNLELESSKKKTLEVEQELHFSTGEALKFEELHKQSGLHAEFETKKVLEFERLLEMAKLSAKEVEAQMAILQEEVKGLYAKIAENEKVEAALKVSNAELSIESELLVETNTQLKSKINELQELLNSEYVEKEATSQQLTQGLAVYESKVNDLQTKLSSTYSDKDEAIEQLHASKTEVEDLKQQLTFDRQRLKSQILSLTETHQNAKKELQTMVLQLEGQLKEQKSNENALKAEIENLKAEIEKKSALNDRLKKFEEQLAAREARVNVEDAGAGSNELKEGMEVKYRETGSPISTPSKRRHKKKLEGTSARSSSSSDTKTQNNEVSSGMTYKFILGVALVSVIVGIVLGKKY